MFSFLKNHPFAVEAFFESLLGLTYAVPKEQLVHLVPECVEIETFNDTWGFVALALVKTKNLPPRDSWNIWAMIFPNGLSGFCKLNQHNGQEIQRTLHSEI